MDNSPQPAPHHAKEHAVFLCKGCDLPIYPREVKLSHSAYCPRCGTKLYSGGQPSLSANLALAVTCLLLFIPSHFFNFISIRLVGVTIPATLPSGTFTLMDEGFPLLALLILFCSSIAPFLVCSSVAITHMSLHFRWFKPLQVSLHIIEKLKHWVMLDVFLVSIAISCFKLQDYADIEVGPGLYGLVFLQLFTIALISRVSIQQYWQQWLPNLAPTSYQDHIPCEHCQLLQPKQSHCLRCAHPLHQRKPYSLLKTSSYLFIASVAIFPANFLSISILITNGQQVKDTIFSGVASLINHQLYGIAVIIFVASIVVPVAKILGLIYLMICIKIKRRVFMKQRMMVYFAIKWVGKWSVMDLFVISIMMTLVDRGQILNFTPGYGAVAFGIVVVFTMLAAESLDPRLLWEPSVQTSNHELLNE